MMLKIGARTWTGAATTVEDMALSVVPKVPTHLDHIEGLSDLALLIQPDGTRWGDRATEWQWSDAAAILDPTPPHYHYLSRPRGASKTSDLAAISLIAMSQLPDDATAYAVAADREQAARLVAMMWGYIHRMGWLTSYGPSRAWSVTQLLPRVRMDALASDSASAYGLLPSLLVVDEIHQWYSTPSARNTWEAIVSASPKVEGCRLVVMSTAGDPAHWTRRIRDHAVSDSRWRAHEVPGPTPWISDDALDEQRALLAPSAFARLHLNQWTEAEDRLVSPGALAECVTREGPTLPERGVGYVIGLDIGLTHDRTAAVVAHMADGVVVVDLVKAWAGTPREPVNLAAVGEWLALVGEDYNRATLVYDPHEATAIVQGLGWRKRRLVAYNFSQSSVGHLAMALYQVMRSRRIALYPDTALIDEMANVRLRETQPQIYRIDHDPQRHDDRVIALALATRHLMDQRPRRVLRCQ